MIFRTADLYLPFFDKGIFMKKLKNMQFVKKRKYN
jgi:hypothetical protein